MEAAQDEWLIERLKKGIEVSGRLPYKYHRRRMYYKIHIFERKRKIIIILERKFLNLQEEVAKLKIFEIFEMNNKRKEPIASSLLYHHITLKPNAFTRINTGSNDSSLDGYLQLDC